MGTKYFGRRSYRATFTNRNNCFRYLYYSFYTDTRKCTLLKSWQCGRMSYTTCTLYRIKLYVHCTRWVASWSLYVKGVCTVWASKCKFAKTRDAAVLTLHNWLWSIAASFEVASEQEPLRKENEIENYVLCGRDMADNWTWNTIFNLNARIIPTIAFL